MDRPDTIARDEGGVVLEFCEKSGVVLEFCENWQNPFAFGVRYHCMSIDNAFLHIEMVSHIVFEVGFLRVLKVEHHGPIFHCPFVPARL